MLATRHHYTQLWHTLRNSPTPDQLGQDGRAQYTQPSAAAFETDVLETSEHEGSSNPNPLSQSGQHL